MPAENGTIILGAGLAGLGAARQTGLPVFEQNSGPGGTAASVSKDGFVFDYGIHVLHSKDRRMYELLEETSTGLFTQKRSAWIYSHGHYAAYPFQVNSSHLPLFLRTKCVFDFLKKKEKREAHNYEDWIRLNFGDGFAETFLIPYSEKFWSVHPREMTFEWTGQRVPRPSATDVLKGALRDHAGSFGPNAVFHYPYRKGEGFGGIANDMAAQIRNIHYNKKAVRIDPDEKRVFFSDDPTGCSYERLISTIPLPELFKILVQTPPAIQAWVDKLRFNSIAIVNLGFDGASISDKHWIHYPDKDLCFFRISFPENFCRGLVPPGKSAVQAEISYDRKNPPCREHLLNRVRQDLIKTGIITPDRKTCFEDVLFLKYGYVIYDHVRREAIQKIHEYLHAINIYPCGRYGSWEYQWADEAIFSGRTTAQDLLNGTHSSLECKTA